MRKLFCLAATALALGGCGYFPTPPDPIRYVTSPAEVSTCRRLGAVGLARTDGEAPYRFDILTAVVPGPPPPDYLVGEQDEFGVRVGREIVGPNFAVRLNVMRDAALSLGASDLLLSRRIYRDWSYVEGVAYSCGRVRSAPVVVSASG